MYVLQAVCERTFLRLKERLTTAPILAYPLANEPFIIDTDASDSGIGAVLSQVQLGEERVIGYHSLRLDKTQRRYCVLGASFLRWSNASPISGPVVWSTVNSKDRSRLSLMAIELSGSRWSVGTLASTSARI